MRYQTIRNHLKSYVILSRRKTTINHAFASAIAPNDSYDEQRIREALAILGQNPDDDLYCAYCGGSAQTWDHVFATVKNSSFSGYGHRLGNLLPCCKSCNSAKGNKDWKSFLAGLQLPAPTYLETEKRITLYLAKFSISDLVIQQSSDYERFQQIRTEILELFGEADKLAKVIRENAKQASLK